jgi:hypothetical protein
VSDPPEFRAVTLYVIGAVAAAALPAMLPFAMLKLSPAGSAGLIDQDVAAPPLLIGVNIAVDFVVKTKSVPP